MNHRIRVFDTSKPLVPYVSQTSSADEWRDAAQRKWQELGLPASPPACLRDPSWESCYLRYGDYPEGGRSYNHQLQEHEPGVAVFRGYKTGPNDYVVDLEHSVILGSLFVRLSTSGYRLYRVYGNECGSLGGGG